MKLSCYKLIINNFNEINKRDCIDEIVHKFPHLPKETLFSIICQEYQRKTKRAYHYHAAPSQVTLYFKRYQTMAKDSNMSPGFLLRMADEVDFSPALLSKFMLEQHYKNEMLVQEIVEQESIRKAKISEMLKNTYLIEDKHLAAEIKLCILADPCYGNISDVIRNSVGLEYEIKLKEELQKLKISFIDEKQLREKGYDKTPDIKLNIPMMIDGHIINWIESKASFGDEERHKEYLKEQYWSYCNRFGPGLVIYWLGYIEELNSYKDQGILISDCLPSASKLTSINPSTLLKRTYLAAVLQDAC